MEEKTKLYFLPMVRLIEMIPYSKWEESDRIKRYMEKLIECLKSEGYVVDASLVELTKKRMEGEEVAMAVMDETVCNDCRAYYRINKF